jgi:RNA polymerase sigma-70 factor (ECF subfamily)
MNHFPDATDPQCTCGFAELVNPNIPQLLRTARRVLPSDDLAWDAVQDCLIHAWTNRRLGADPVGSLNRLTRLKSLAIRRADQRRARREVEFGQLGAVAESDPAQAPLRAERREAVRRALRHLPRECAAVIDLCDLQGLDRAAAASRLDVPVGTVRSRLHRARRLLRDRLTGLEPDGAAA